MPSPPDDLGSVCGEGDVAAVDPADLRAFLKMSAETPGGSVFADRFESVCSPGADVSAVWYRAALLKLIATMHNLELTDVVFKIAATFPMKKLPIGGQKDLPLDVQGFLAEIEREENNN